VLYLIEQGVLSVTDAVDAVSWGPGLRWGVMARVCSSTSEVGRWIQHFIDHLLRRWSLCGRCSGDSGPDPESKQRLADGLT